jgi:hypothetical protein
MWVVVMMFASATTIVGVLTVVTGVMMRARGRLELDDAD